MDKTYRTIRLPTKQVEMIEKFIEKHPECGYMSKSEFVKDAVRHHYCLFVHGVFFDVSKKATSCDVKSE